LESHQTHGELGRAEPAPWLDMVVKQGCSVLVNEAELLGAENLRLVKWLSLQKPRSFTEQIEAVLVFVQVRDSF
jgi:hypothetical protein